MLRKVIWGLEEALLVPRKPITDKSYITGEKQPLQRKDKQVALEGVQAEGEHGWQHPIFHTEEEEGKGFCKGVAQEGRLQHISPASLCSGSLSHFCRALARCESVKRLRFDTSSDVPSNMHVGRPSQAKKSPSR